MTEKIVEQPKDAKFAQVLTKVRSAKSVLVALSKNPSIDEMAAALGLTIMLDKMGKHVTAIYSGRTPNALEFLKPDETFEKNTHSLQEFIIALDKNKADHLRYKVEGDYVKIFITPYRTDITKDDLEFSRGGYNVDLVIAMNVMALQDLDAALAEHGRILHNATTINMSVGEAGRFGEIEWAKNEVSSVSEMVFELVSGLKNEKNPIEKDVATALLTGIVAATNRFSNEKTTPETMEVAGRLMAEGADQQLVSANVPVEVGAIKMGVSDSNIDAVEDAVVKNEENNVDNSMDDEAGEAEGKLEIINEGEGMSEENGAGVEMVGLGGNGLVADEIKTVELGQSENDEVADKKFDERMQEALAEKLPVEMQESKPEKVIMPLNNVEVQEIKGIGAPAMAMPETVGNGAPAVAMPETVGNGAPAVAMPEPVLNMQNDMDRQMEEVLASDELNQNQAPVINIAPEAPMDFMPPAMPLTMPPAVSPVNSEMSNVISEMSIATPAMPPVMPEMPSAASTMPPVMPQVNEAMVVPQMPVEPMAAPMQPIQSAESAVAEQQKNETVNDPAAFRIPGM